MSDCLGYGNGCRSKEHKTEVREMLVQEIELGIVPSNIERGMCIFVGFSLWLMARFFYDTPFTGLSSN